jgi:cyclophilin family peptidyl-prolyl cis-trans isomerase
LLNNHQVILKMRTESMFKRDLTVVGSVVQLIGVLAITLLLASCGVGWENLPNVSGVTTTTPKYSQPMRIAISGVNLDQGITVSSPGCTGMVRSTTPPFESSATLAYYECIVSTLGDNNVQIARIDGTSLHDLRYNVPLPNVTMRVSNAAGGGNVHGDIDLTLRPDRAPITVDNLLFYVNSGFYNGTVFHRIGPNSTTALKMIQGGGFVQGTTSLVLKTPTRSPIALEVDKGLSNVQWSIAMARTTEPNSATSQFFINYFGNTELDTAGGGYAVFGTVTGGFNVVNAIAGVSPCAARAGVTETPYCTPSTNITIVSAIQTK